MRQPRLQAVFRPICSDQAYRQSKAYKQPSGLPEYSSQAYMQHQHSGLEVVFRFYMHQSGHTVCSIQTYQLWSGFSAVFTFQAYVQFSGLYAVICYGQAYTQQAGLYMQQSGLHEAIKFTGSVRPICSRGLEKHSVKYSQYVVRDTAKLTNRLQLGRSQAR